MKRVVVTGVGAISPLGNDWPTVLARLREERNAVRHMTEWDKYDGLNTRLGAPAAAFELPAHYNRKSTRSMGRVALLGTRASELALQRVMRAEASRCYPRRTEAGTTRRRPGASD